MPEGIFLFVPAIYDIVWSLIPFALIMGFFLFFAVPRLRTILDQRAEAIEGNVEKAERAEAEARALREQYEQLLVEARAEAAAIRDKARAEGHEILAELKQQATADAARIHETARQQIDAERQSALQSLQREVGVLAIDLSERVVGETMDDARAASIVDRFLADLESEGAGTR